MCKCIKKDEDKHVFLNEAIYGVSCELYWCQSYLEYYLQGHCNVLEIIGTNHNAKTSR